jgi:hypothetical protein
MNNNNDRKKSEKEWSKEWELEKQTEGLSKKAVQEQEKIFEKLKKEDKSNNGRCC